MEAGVGRTPTAGRIRWQAALVLVSVASLLSGLGADPGSGTTEGTAVVELPTVVVTASRYREELAEIAGTVSVLAGEEVRASVARTLTEALRYLPGISIQRVGGLGTRELFSIQGSEPRQVTLLLDGIPLNSLSSGQSDPVQIPVELVDRAEVVEGTVSSSWGPALGGVVQVLTPAAAGRAGSEVKVKASHGSWGTGRAALTVRHGTRDAGCFVLLNGNTTDGFRSKSAHGSRVAFAKVERRSAGSVLTASAGVNDGRTEDFVRYGKPMWKRHEYQTVFGQASWRRSGVRGWEMYVQGFGVGRNEEVQYRGMADDGLLQGVQFDEPAWGLAARARREAGKWGGCLVGLDTKWSEADFRYQGGPGPQGFDEEGAYLRWNRPVGQGVVSGGLRYDRHSLYGAQWSPEASVLYRVPVQGMRVWARMGRGFGAPPLSVAYLPETERYAPTRDLKAERVTSTSAGVAWQPSEWLLMSGTWFHNDVTDAVDSALNEDGKLVQRNFARQTRRGVEVRGQAVTDWGLQIRGGVALNDVRGVDAEEIINGTARQTRDVVVRYAKEQVGLAAWLGGHWVDYEIAEYLEQPPTLFSARDRRFVWDVKLAKALPKRGGAAWDLTMSVRNLFDTRAWWLTPYPEPGRSYELALSARLGRLLGE